MPTPQGVLGPPPRRFARARKRKKPSHKVSEAIQCVRRDLLERAANRHRADLCSSFPSQQPTGAIDSNGIYVVKDKADLPRAIKQGRRFEAVVDTGAARSVVGLRTARRLARSVGEKLRLTQYRRSFRFGTTVHESLGTMTTIVPTPGGCFRIQIDVVEADVPFLLGLDALDAHRLQALSVTSQLEHVPIPSDNSIQSLGWRVPLKRRQGHLLWEFYPIRDAHEILYTRVQLEKLHRQLYHPSTEKLLNLLKRADPDRLDKDTRSLLEDIAKRCHACQTLAPAPLTFRIALPGTAQFNRRILLDLMFISDPSSGKRQPILHVVDEGTSLQAAAFLAGEDARTVWTTLCLIWTRLYVGDPSEVLTDSGSVFKSAYFSDQCSARGITLRHTPVESHNSLGKGETFHSPLRKIYLKLSQTHPSIDRALILQLAVFAINSTANAKGLIPLLLVYGRLPNLPDFGDNNPTHEERYAAIDTARQEYEKIIAAERVRTGLAKNVPPAADTAYSEGDNVYLWRETQRRWTGPHIVLPDDGTGDPKTVLLAPDKGVPRRFSTTRVKRALVTNVNWTEVLTRDDARVETPEMMEALRKEILALISRGTFKLVVLDENHSENVLPTKLVFAIKHSNSGETKCKVRFVLGGHRDVEKTRMVQTAKKPVTDFRPSTTGPCCIVWIHRLY